MNATQFLYGDQTPGISAKSVYGLEEPSGTGSATETYSGDFNGDGYSDVIQTSMANVAPAATYPTGFVVKLFDPVSSSFNALYSYTSPYKVYVSPGPHAMSFAVHRKFNKRMSDFDGNGIEDIIVAEYQSNQLHGFKMFFNNGSGTPLTKYINSTVPNGQYRSFDRIIEDRQFMFVGDFDGDGRSEFISILSDQSGNNKSFVSSTFSNFAYKELTFDSDPNTNSNIMGILKNAHYASVIDINGDGKNELFFISSDNNNSHAYIYAFERVLLSNEWIATQISNSGYPTKWHAIFPGDFNGDGKTDLLTRVWNNMTKWEIAISDGFSFNNKQDVSFTLNPNFRTSINSHNHNTTDDLVSVVDLNGDGKSDIITGNWTTSNNVYDIHYHVGINQWKDESYFFSREVGTNTKAVFADITGDGKTDLLQVKVNYSAGDPYPLYQFKHSTPGDRCLKTVRNGLGLWEHIDYLPLSTTDPNHYKFNGHTAYPFNTLKIPLLTVSSTYNTLPSQSAFNKVYYRYEDLKFARDGRGLIGFSTFFTHHLASGTISKNVVESYHPAFLVPSQFRKETGLLVNNNYTVLSTERTSLGITSLGGKRYKTVPSSTTLTDLLRNTTATTNYTYNSDGNPTNITTNNANIETSVTSISYAAASATLTPVPAKPEIITETRTRSGAPAVSKTVKHAYQNGKLTKITDFSNLSDGLATDFSYDLFGNLVSKIVHPVTTSVGRSETYQYDPTNRYLIATINSLGQMSSRQIDNRWGVALSETAFGNVTGSYTYDGFGRLTSRIMPEGYTVYDSLKWGTSVLGAINSSCYTHILEDPSTTNQYQHHTPLGSLWNTKTLVWYTGSGQNISNRKFGENTTTYDLLNRPIETQTPAVQSQTPAESYVKTGIFYDPLGRVDKEERRDNSNNVLLGKNTYSYTYQNGNLTTTITDLANRQKYSITDPTGKVIETGDPSGIITFQYDSWGNVTKTFTGGVLVSENTYDAYNRRKTTKESSSGTTQYEYNAFGEVVRQTDAAGNVSSWGYDDLGRLEYKLFPEGSIQYTYYNNATNGSGNKLWKETRYGPTSNVEYETEYKYDALGRAYRTNFGTNFTEYTFDAYGRVETTRYSSGIKLKNTYKCGLLHEILELNGQRRYWLQDVNGLGKPKLEWRSNGKTTTNTYQYGAATRNETPGVQDYQLTYDWAKGLITRRRDNLMNLHDDFSYDNADRLKQVQGGVNGPLIPAIPPPVQDLSYGTSALTSGNILTKSDIGSYGYSLPHQMHYTDNAAGAIPLIKQDVKYASFHRPTEITEGPNKAVFSYGTDDERVVMESYDNNVLRYKKFYHADGVEKITNGNGQLVNIVTYVPGNDGIALIYVQRPGRDPLGRGGSEATAGTSTEPTGDEPYQQLTTDIYYPYTDHLGSITALTDGTGTVVQRQAFDAWGRRRNAVTWQTDDTQVPSAGFEWLRGYTGHEHLDSFGLINMNARLYDPKMGRMLSVDNYVSAPGSALGYNRYTYAMNNPVMYTDPSGNFLAIPFLAIGFLAEFTSNLIGGYSNAGGRAFNAVTQNMKEISSVARVGDGNFSIGLNPLAVGVDVQFSGKIGNTSIGGSAGIGLGGFYAGGGVSQQVGNWQLGLSGSTNGTTYSAGGGISYDDGKTSLGYYLTYYGGGVSPTGEKMNQWVGGVGFRSGDFGLRLENDFLARMGGDAWRTQALEFQVGDFSFGSWIYTNDGQTASGYQNEKLSGRPSTTWGANRAKGLSSWPNGQVFRAPVYAGYKNGNTTSRIGFSHWRVQDIQQNGTHTQQFFKAGNQNYYLDYGYFDNSPYLFGGYANPYSLFGF